MRKCVTCGISNVKVKLVGIQCEKCLALNPVNYPTPLLPEIKQINEDIVRADLEKIKARRKLISRFCECGNIAPLGKRVYNDCRTKEYRCMVCGNYEPDTSLLRKRKDGVVFPQHINCSKAKPKTKKERHKLTLFEKLARLPEEKACKGCDLVLPISEYYINKQGYAYHYCKECHYKKTVRWKEDNREKVLAYHREYGKTHKRTQPGRTKFPLLEALSKELI